MGRLPEPGPHQQPQVRGALAYTRSTQTRSIYQLVQYTAALLPRTTATESATILSPVTEETECVLMKTAQKASMASGHPEEQM